MPRSTQLNSRTIQRETLVSLLDVIRKDDPDYEPTLITDKGLVARRPARRNLVLSLVFIFASFCLIATKGEWLSYVGLGCLPIGIFAMWFVIGDYMDERSAAKDEQSPASPSRLHELTELAKKSERSRKWLKTIRQERELVNADFEAIRSVLVNDYFASLPDPLEEERAAEQDADQQLRTVLDKNAS